MKITANTMLFVVNNERSDGVSHMTLEGLVNAVQGGMKVAEVTVFTGIDEADEHHKRVRLLCKGSTLLSSMDIEKLEKLVSKIESDEIDELLGRVLP